MPLLSEQEIERRLHALAGWERQGDALRREFKLRDFAGSVEFVNRIAPVAEEMNHHPELAISWNRVPVSLPTHPRGGITESDCALAEELDALAT